MKRIIAFTVLVAVMLLTLNELFLYNDKSVWSTDTRVEQYKELPEDSLDMLFVGSSVFMSGINPLQIWKETGIQSYSYSSRAQTFAFTYAYLKDALKTQNPEVVVMDTYSLFTNKDYRELANTEFHAAVNMDNLSLSSRHELIRAHIPWEEKMSYYFPLLRNHNLYKTWEAEEDKTDEIFFGYSFVEGYEPFDDTVFTEEEAEMYYLDTFYLRKILQLCNDEGAELMVLRTPVVCTVEEYAVLNKLELFCDENDVFFYNMTEDAKEWEFNYQTDMLDNLHANKLGAEKITNRLVEVFSERYDFSDSNTRQHANVWEEEYQRMLTY